MATREEVQHLLDTGLDYEAAGQRLGIPAGQAYLIATGRPADGSAEPAAEDTDGGPAGGSAQQLADPPHYNPTTSQQVRDWMAGRASADAQMQAAAEEQDQDS
ncbi:MAG TPA: hypothetical protein VG268_06300 [Streptosporangiaceae bacterium]|nr:hypothetical protein [Streptosporangiaceae bacterium]